MDNKAIIFDGYADDLDDEVYRAEQVGAQVRSIQQIYVAYDLVALTEGTKDARTITEGDNLAKVYADLRILNVPAAIYVYDRDGIGLTNERFSQKVIFENGELVATTNL